MPHTFLQMGARWLNLDLVSSVEFISDPQDPARILLARVWFTAGGSVDFRSAADVQALGDWLRAHRAP